MILKPPPGAGGGSASGPDADARSAATSGADGRERGGRGGEGADLVCTWPQNKGGHHASPKRSAASKGTAGRTPSAPELHKAFMII